MLAQMYEEEARKKREQARRYKYQIEIAQQEESTWNSGELGLNNNVHNNSDVTKFLSFIQQIHQEAAGMPINSNNSNSSAAQAMNLQFASHANPPTMELTTRSTLNVEISPQTRDAINIIE